MARWVDTAERTIAAPPAAIFALIADPSRHQDIDGSGTVRAATEPSRQVKIGDEFGMNMEFGGAYTMTSTVIEFEADRRIAWQSRPPKDASRWRHMFGGRIWRYELQPVEGGTVVRESWDLSEEGFRLLVWGYRHKTHSNMVATLERIEALVTD
jgi:uncharacterized protein YndB with AHSA1/START domain